VNLGSVLVELGREAEGEAAYRDALARDPANAEAYFNLAVLAYRRGRWTEAADLARACLARDPAHARAKSLRDDADAKAGAGAPRG
jgi:cytochrome c-type biogenesis protein CcmH/NrfG